MHPHRPGAADTGTPDRYLERLPNGGRRVLLLPGLTLRWERVILVLDKLAEAGIPTLTVDGLRECIR